MRGRRVGITGVRGGRRRLRNEANRWGRGHVFNGLGEWQGLGGGGRAGGLETFELAQGALIGALGGVDAALEANENAVAAGEGVAEGRALVEAKSRIHFIFPDLGVGLGEATELPVIADESVHIEALFGSGGPETFEVFGGEGFQLGLVLAADDVGLRVDAGFQGIHGGGGLALCGARTG